MPRHERAPSQWAGRWDALSTIEAKHSVCETLVCSGDLRQSEKLPLNHESA